VFHSIPVLDFLGPSWWHILKQSIKAPVIKDLLPSDHSEQETRQIFSYEDFTIIGFV
jgi:hypothetical protein